MLRFCCMGEGEPEAYCIASGTPFQICHGTSGTWLPGGRGAGGEGLHLKLTHKHVGAPLQSRNVQTSSVQLQRIDWHLIPGTDGSQTRYPTC